MRELTMDEVQDVGGGLLGFVVVAISAVLGGCATMHQPGEFRARAEIEELPPLLPPLRAPSNPPDQAVTGP